MEGNLMAESAKYGLGFLFFTFLFLWQLKCNEVDKKRYIEREDKYQGIIQGLAGTVPEILDDVKVIMSDMNAIKIIMAKGKN